MEQYRFAGFRVVGFPDACKLALREIAERLAPHQAAVVEKWMELQFRAWRPPGMDQARLTVLFGDLYGNMLRRMALGELEACISDLEDSGAQLARSEFPFEALIISLHFLEESYMPLLLYPHSDRTQDWFIHMDEFLHVGIAALATSYFQFHRDQLLADAHVGQVVQEALFPHPPRRIGDLDLGFVYASASERARLGGDFLDVFGFGDGGTAFVLGDLSGHGLEAAAGSATIRSLFRGFMRDRSDLCDAFERLNRSLFEELEENQFATALAGTYSAPGRLTLVNAGHPLPFVCGDRSRVIEQTKLPLAIYEASTYAQVEVEMAPGDVFVAYTDGVSEARVRADLFGEERIIEAVEEMRDAPPRAIAEHVKDKAVRHANGLLMDDMAILVLKRREGT